jgi:hypothetical protein
MKTHELADLLANVVLVLRRLPDVECRELGNHLANTEQDALAPKPIMQTQDQQSPKLKFTLMDLESKKLPEVKQIAKDLHLTISSKSTKKDLISKILVRQEQEYSDQFAIQHL